MSDLNIALVLRFIDQATAPARKAMEGIQGAAQAVEQFGARQITQGRAMQETALQNTSALRGSTLATVATAAALVASLNPAIAFEAQMSKVGAVSKATAEEQTILADVALRESIRTRFKASEAAEGMEYLAMAGLSVNDTIAALPGVLDLAAASGVGLGETANIATNILSGFQMQVAEMGRVGDVLTNAFTGSNTTLTGLGLTMSYVAPIASGLGVDLETTAAMAGRLGQNGLAGEKAGTALRAILTRLAAPSTAARRALDDLNVSISDANGNMRPIPEILAEMHIAMSGMGQVAREELNSVIFGMEAAAAAGILMREAGSGDLQAFADSLRETGSAAEVAARMMDNTRGRLDRMMSAVQFMQIKIGQGVNPVLDDLTERVMPIALAIGEWADANQGLVKIIAWSVAALIGLQIATLAAGWGFWLLFGWVGKLRVAIGALIVAKAWLVKNLMILVLQKKIATVAALAFGNVMLWLGRMAVLALWGIRALAAGLWALASRAALAALAALRVVGLAALWLGRALLGLAGRAVVAALAGLRALGGAVLWLGRALALAARALLMNPIFWVIAAIAGAVYVIYKNWDGIVSYFTDKIDRVAQAFDQGLLNGVLALLAEFNPFVLITDAAEGLFTYLTGWTFADLNAALIGFIGFDPFTELKALAERFFTYVTGWTFDDVGQALRAAFDIDLYAVGVDLITRLGEGIWSVLTGLVARIRAELVSIAPDWLVNGINRLRGGGAAASDAGGGVAGARALGGPVRPGFVYEINEQGREFFMPDVPGRVVPASMFAGSGPEPMQAPLSSAAASPARLGDGVPQTVRLVERFTALVERLPAIPGPFQTSPTREVSTQTQTSRLVERFTALVEQLPAIPGPFSEARDTTAPERAEPLGGLARAPGSTSGDGAQPLSVTFGDINISVPAGANPEQIARLIKRALAEQMREMRYALHDGGLHD